MLKLNYLGSILVADVTEKHHLQQGNRDDISPYTFAELMKEIMS